MPSFFIITFRCHSLNVQTFEITFPILLEVVKKYAITCYWAIEKEDKVDKHIHIWINTEDEFDCGASFKQRLLKRAQLKPFLTYLRFSMTDVKVALDVKSISKDEETRTLGYVFKEPILGRNDTGDASPKYIFDCVKEYYEHKKLESIDFIEKNDWKLITTKNIYSQISNFVEQQKTKYSDPNLILKMKKSFYGFVNISPKNIRRVLFELQLAHEDHTYDEPYFAEQHAKAEQNGDEFDKTSEYEEKIKKLSEYIKNLSEPDEIPKDIKLIIFNN